MLYCIQERIFFQNLKPKKMSNVAAIFALRDLNKKTHYNPNDPGCLKIILFFSILFIVVFLISLIISIAISGHFDPNASYNPAGY